MGTCSNDFATNVTRFQRSSSRIIQYLKLIRGLRASVFPPLFFLAFFTGFETNFCAAGSSDIGSFWRRSAIWSRSSFPWRRVSRRLIRLAPWPFRPECSNDISAPIPSECIRAPGRLIAIASADVQKPSFATAMTQSKNDNDYYYKKISTSLLHSSETHSM